MKLEIYSPSNWIPSWFDKLSTSQLLPYLVHQSKASLSRCSLISLVKLAWPLYLIHPVISLSYLSYTKLFISQ